MIDCVRSYKQLDCQEEVFMGSIRKRGQNWYIDYSYKGRRYKEKIGPDKNSAKVILNKKLTEIAENRFLDKRIETTLTFREFSEFYMETYSKPNKKSWKSCDLVRIKALTPYFGGHKLDMISPTQIEDYKKHRLTSVAPSTVNRELTCLKHLYNKANEWEKTDKNPAKLIRKLRENNSRLRYLTEEEMTQLIANANGYLEAIIILALNTGMRRGEILSIRKHDIDYALGLIYLLVTKNGDRRNVPMNTTVMNTLKNLPPIEGSDYIFRNQNGQPIVNIDKKFPQLLKKTGIENFRFHDLRHTFASRLAMKSIDINMIRELLGHKSLNMTLRYSHLSPSHKKKAVEILDFEQQSVPCSSPNEFPAII